MSFIRSPVYQDLKYKIECTDLFWLQPLKYKVAICLDSREYYERYLPKTLIGLGNETLPIMIGTNVSNGDDSADERSPEGQ